MNHAITREIVLGSRPSRLALWQSEHVISLLEASNPGISCRLVTMVTEGDKNLTQALPEIGGKGVFTAELEGALLAGEIDLAVHSLKDLPVESPEGLAVGAVSARADARDVLISPQGLKLEGLPAGARVGTSSLRRQAQLLAARPDLTILPLRGNVDTRIRKSMQGDYDAIILAAAGVQRLGIGDVISEILSLEVMLPAPGQGALAVQCRAGDRKVLGLLQAIHDDETERAVTAERSFLSALDAGCSAPVAAYARLVNGLVEIQGMVGSVDGKRIIRVQACGEDPWTLGRNLAKQALRQGAGELLK